MLAKCYYKYVVDRQSQELFLFQNKSAYFCRFCIWQLLLTSENVWYRNFHAVKFSLFNFRIIQVGQSVEKSVLLAR